MNHTLIKDSPVAPAAQGTSTHSFDPRTAHHQVAATTVNERAQHIAQSTLEALGGRCTYSWENDSIQLEYQGDIIDGEGKRAYGKTMRRYAFTDQSGERRWVKSSPLKSESGTGLINLGWQHFHGCTDPLVKAKLELWHLLMSPELGIAAFVVQNFHNKAPMAGNIRERLTLRLEEILEQLVLSNPATQDTTDKERAAGGLDLQEVADGTHIVGWAVKVLEASIPNTLRRIRINEPVLSQWDESPDIDAHRLVGITQSALGEEHLVAGADEQYEDDRLSEVGAEYAESAPRKRGHERVIYDANVLHRATDLPFLRVPPMSIRKSLIAQLDEDESLPLRSLKAYYDLVGGSPTPDQLGISDDWLNLWGKYENEDAFRLLGISSAHAAAPALIVRAAIGFFDPLTETAKNTMKRTLGRLLRDQRWHDLVADAVTAFDKMRTTGNERGWASASTSLLSYPLSPVTDIETLEDTLDEAMKRSRAPRD